MSTTTVPRSAPVPTALRGPAPLGVAAWLLTIGAVLTGAVLGGPIPSPFASTDVVSDYFRTEGDAALASAVVTLLSITPLVLFTAGLAGLLARSAHTADRAPVVTAAGTAAGAFAAASAGGLWVLARPQGDLDPDVAHLVAQMVFAAGGPLFALMIGISCLSTAAATRSGPTALPRGMNVAGFVLGGVGVLGFLGMVWEPLILLMPVARFGGLGWLTATAFVVARRLDAGAVR